MSTRRQLDAEIDAALASRDGTATGSTPHRASRDRILPRRAGGKTLCLNPACSNRTGASAGYCQGCKSKRHHAHRLIASEGLIVDQAGQGWWIWDASGNVLVMGKDTRADAINALAFGDDVDEVDE